MTDKYRLVTRSDFDGLVCAVLMHHLDMIDDIKFVHPKDMQDGKVETTGRDITTNLPYVPNVHLCIDHHESETLRNERASNHVIDPTAPSAARVVWRCFGGHDKFPASWDDMLDAVDKADAARYTIDEILRPGKWELLNFVMDPRTGLGRFQDFKISNYDLMMKLVEDCGRLSIDDIMEQPDVAERVALYYEHADLSRDQILRCSSVHDHVVLLDLTAEETIYAANRFYIYALFPQCNVSIHKIWGFKRQNMVFAVGKSIIDRGARVNIGELMLEYGGGGHTAAGTCQVPIEDSDRVQAELLARITGNRAFAPAGGQA
ncbi:MAG: exopolyphosphatase [Acidimicrobiales bacterium]